MRFLILGWRRRAAPMRFRKSDRSLMAVRGPLKSAKIPRRWKKVTHRIASPLAKTALALFTCVFLAVLIWKYPQWLSLLRSITDPKERLTLENEILKTMIQIVGGAFLLG